MVGLFVKQLHHAATEVEVTSLLMKTSEKDRIVCICFICIACTSTCRFRSQAKVTSFYVAVGGRGLCCLVGVCVCVAVCICVAQ